VISRLTSILTLCVCLLGVRAEAATDDLLKDEIGPFSASVLQRLRDKRFAELDALEQELRQSKARFTGGDWQLAHFYGALSGALIPEGVAINSDWLELITLQTEWRTQAPQSTVVSLVLAQTYYGWAWHARGTGRAATVSEQQFAIFHDRLNQGAFYLNENRRVSGNNPQWFTVALRIGLGSQWSKERITTLFKQAVAVEPLYQHTYSQMAVYLLPRWYGEPGEWEAFADEATAEVGGQQGAAIYNHIIVRVAQSYSAKAFFEENDLNWRRIQWSFADRERLYGAGREALNSQCWLADGVADRPTARALMARIGDSWDPAVWGTRQRFDLFQKSLTGEP
jgi:hypothetical protein